MMMDYESMIHEKLFTTSGGYFPLDIFRPGGVPNRHVSQA